MWLFGKKKKYFKKIEIAESLRKEGKLEEAINAYLDAFEDIINVKDYFNLACIYIDLKEYDKAIHIFEDIVNEIKNKNDSVLADVYFGLGLCHDNLCQKELAIENYEAAIKYGYNNPDCYYFLAYLYDEEEKDKDSFETKRAIECLEKAINLAPDYVYSYVCLGNIYARCEDNEKALKCFLKSLELDKDNVTNSNYNVAVTYDVLGKKEEALKYYLEELKAPNPFKAVYYNLGILYKDMKKYDESLQYYLKAIELDKEDFNAWYNLACLYALMNDFDNAFSCLTYIKYNKKKYLESTKTDDELVELRKDKRYEELFK